jgi:hypothetical protein
MSDFAWVVLAMWAITAGVALPLSRHAFAESPMLALQALIALTGLTLSIVFVAAEPSEAIAWIGAGLGAVGAVAVAFGAAWLMSDAHGQRTASQQGHEEADALLAGVELPLFIVTGMLSAVLAAFVTTPGLS